MTDHADLTTNESALVTDGEVALETILPRARSSQLARPRFFWINAAVLLIGLLIGVLVMNNDSIAVPDDGVYAAQARLLAETGSWSMKRPGPTVDKDGSNSALSPSVAWDDRQIPYARHPLFSISLVPFFKAGRYGGLMAYSAIGTWAAAIAAGLLARRLKPIYGLPAMWLCGVGSPLLFDAFLVSGLSMAAAAFGFAIFGLTRVIDELVWRPLWYALPCITLAVMLRSEATIAVGATTLVIGTMALVPLMFHRHQARPLLGQVDWRGVIAAITVGVMGIIAYVLDATWSRSLVAASGDDSSSLVRTLKGSTGPLSATWASLLRPWSGGFDNASPTYALAAMSVILAAFTIRVHPRRLLLPISLLLMAAISLFLAQFSKPVLVTGLLAAFPLLPAGLLLLRRAHFNSTLTIRLLTISLITIATLIFTIYGVGGAAEWGGRFFHIVIPTMVPVAIVGIAATLGSVSVRTRILLATLGIAIALLLSLTSIRLQTSARLFHRLLTTIVIATPSHDVPHEARDRPQTDPLVILGLFDGSGSARFLWDTPSDISVISSVGIQNLPFVIFTAAREGYDSVIVLSNLDKNSLHYVTARHLEPTGWQIINDWPTKRDDIHSYEFGHPSN